MEGRAFKSAFNISAISPCKARIAVIELGRYQKAQKYRILYAYNGHIDEVYLLAIVFKPDTCSIQNGEYYDCEPSHRITQRMLNSTVSSGCQNYTSNAIGKSPSYILLAAPAVSERLSTRQEAFFI